MTVLENIYTGSNWLLTLFVNYVTPKLKRTFTVLVFTLLYPQFPPLGTLLDTRTYVDGLLMSIFTNCSLVFIALYPKVNFPPYLHLGKKKKKQIFNDQLFLIKCSPSPIKMSYYSPPRTQFPGLFYRQIVQKWIYVSA